MTLVTDERLHILWSQSWQQDAIMQTKLVSRQEEW